MRLVVISVPQSRRSDLLHAAAARWPGLALVEVAWIDLLEGRIDLRSVVREGDVVRIDSPGRDFATEIALLRRGRDSQGLHHEVPTAQQISELRFEKGRLLWPAVWYAGFCSALGMIADQLTQYPRHQLTNDVDAIQVAFDKSATSHRLSAAGIPVPPALGRVGSFDELVDRCRSLGWTQVFLKLAHGSSASGIVALRIGRDRMHARTTTEIESDGSSARLYNTRAVRTIVSIGEIRRVVDHLCRHIAHAERWIPKAGIDGKCFDLRVVTVGRYATHVVVRASHSPMTNLHLLNTRGDVERVRERCGTASWDLMLDSCQRSASSFDGCHCIGIDVMFDNTFRRHAVLEVNAFGDLLPGVTVNGMDTYAAQLASLFGLPATTQCGFDAGEAAA